MAGRTFPRRKVRRILGQRERLKVIDISLPLHSFLGDEKSTCAIGKWPCLSVCLICLPSCQVREDCSHLARISAEVKDAIVDTDSELVGMGGATRQASECVMAAAEAMAN